jgi:hypothetical protein
MRTREIPLFLGTSTSVDKKNLEPLQASRELNARHEDGALRARYGFKNLRAAQSGFTADYGLVYLQGINSSNAEVEEYVSVETVSGSTDAFSRHVTTLAPTAITGATALHASAWAGFPWNDVSYFINPNHTTNVYRHTIGDATSWTGITIPADPATALTYQFVYDGSGGSAYAQLSWAGLDPSLAGEMATTGLATNTGSTLNSDNSFNVRHTAGSGPGDASFEIDFDDITAGDQDWQYNDAFALTLTEDPSGAFEIDPASIVATMTNEDGSPSTFTLDVRTQRMTMPGAIRVWMYARQKTRSLWDNIGTFKLSYRVVRRSGTASNNDLTVSKLWIGCTFPFFSVTGQSSDVGLVRFGYSYRVSSSGLESGIAGELQIFGRDTEGYDPLGGGPFGNGLGVFIKFTSVASGDAAVNQMRLYWFDAISLPNRPQTPNVWKRIVTQDDATTTYTLKASLDEMLALAEREGAGGFLTSPVNNAFPFKEWVVWLYGIGEANVRHSRVRAAEQQASDLDMEDDENRGVNFTLADNFADTPQCGCQAGNSALIGGLNGIYEQVHDGSSGPPGMSPCKKLPGSFGVAGKFAMARWKDDHGNPGAAFVDRHGSGVYFAYPSGVGDRDAEGRVIELSAGIRGEVQRFLFNEQSALGLTDFSTCEVFVDDSQDALGIKLGQRILWLRRPNTVTGQREWEYAAYNMGGATTTIGRIAASPKRRIRGLASDGKVHEWEWNSADSVFIQGRDRDGGNPMPPGFWRSKTHSGQNRRIVRLYLDRENHWEVARIRVRSNRLDQRYRIEPHKKFTSCARLQQGFDHEFEIEILEMDGKYSRLFWDEEDMGRRVNL